MRLIDADELTRKFVNLYDDDRDYIEIADAIDMIEESASVDAVPVVRCKDCEYWSDFVDEKAGVGKFKYCELLNVSTYADFYCRLGERNGTDDN